MKMFLLAVTALLAITQTRAQTTDYMILKDWNIREHNRSYDDMFRFFSQKNFVFVIGVPLGLTVEGYIKNDKDLIRAGKNAFISLGASTVVTWALKYSCNRRRPFEKYEDVRKMDVGGGSSFPSGHTSAAFAVATSVSMSYPKWYIIVPCYLWAGTVGVSRIALGVHYPSDVLVGAGVGIVSAYVTNKANKWLKKDKHKSLARL